MTHVTRMAVAFALLALPLATGADAQSRQKVSLQGSGALVFPTASETDFQNDTRLGWEIQARYTFSRFSLGGGYQQATVYKLEGTAFSGSVSVGFLEPRYVVTATARLAIYVAGRVGVGTLVCSPEQDCADQSLEPAFGGGAGVLIGLTDRLAIDVGSQLFSTRFTRADGAKTNAGYLLARVGLSVGLF